MVDKSMTLPDYPAWLGDMKSRIRSARTAAARSVNRELILRYWDIGRRIVEKQEQLGWGKSVVEKLSRDLNVEFPAMTGFSSRNLWDMRRMVEVYTVPEFLRQLVAEIPWGHNLLILNKLSDPVERLYYLRATDQFG